LKLETTFMRFIGNVIDKLQRHPKRVVFLKAKSLVFCRRRRQFQALHLGAPIVLGDQTKVKEVAESLNISLDGIRVINPLKVKMPKISPSGSFASP